MAGSSAVVFVPDDTSKTGYTRPLMLCSIMGSRLLSWLVAALVADGVGRFFLVCHERFLAEAKACFPQDVELTTSGNQNASDLLHVFLSTSEDEEQDVLVVTGPAIRLKEAATVASLNRPVPSCVYAANRAALMEALDDTDQFSFKDFLHTNGLTYTDRDGVFSISSGEDLMAWQPVLNHHRNLQLVRAGVEIWDEKNCYVDPTAFVGAGTVLLPGTILRGHTVVGKDCTIGPGAYLSDTMVGDGSTVGQSRLEKVQVGFDARIGSWCTLGPDVIVEAGAVVESGTMLHDPAQISPAAEDTPREETGHWEWPGKNKK